MATWMLSLLLLYLDIHQNGGVHSETMWAAEKNDDFLLKQMDCFVCISLSPVLKTAINISVYNVKWCQRGWYRTAEWSFHSVLSWWHAVVHKSSLTLFNVSWCARAATQQCKMTICNNIRIIQGMGDNGNVSATERRGVGISLNLPLILRGTV